MSLSVCRRGHPEVRFEVEDCPCCWRDDVLATLAEGIVGLATELRNIPNMPSETVQCLDTIVSRVTSIRKAISPTDATSGQAGGEAE